MTNKEYTPPYLQNNVPFLQVSILAGKSCAGHLFDEELAAQTKAIFCKNTNHTYILCINKETNILPYFTQLHFNYI